MTAPMYRNFDLRFERTAIGYRAVVLGSPAGEASAVVDLEAARTAWLREAGASPGAGGADRHVLPPSTTHIPPAEVLKRVGGLLFEAVFTGDIRDAWHDSGATVREQDSGLRLRLRLNDAPELAALPWEYLYAARRDAFLALSRWTPVVRYLDAPAPPRPLCVASPLRILVTAASPAAGQPLAIEAEWGHLQEALTDLQERGLVALERLESPTLGALQARLRQSNYHVWHFIGHGRFDPLAGAALLMEAEGDGSHWVNGSDLSDVVADHRSLRLVLLNACEGARASDGDPFLGLAPRLVQGGLPAAIAMSRPIGDRAAVALARAFYAALADGAPVDAALTDARQALRGQGDSVAWGTPVLFLRAEDGRLFDLTPLSPEAQRRRQVAAIERAAAAAEAQGDWPAAETALRQWLALEPAAPAIAERLETVGRRREADELAQRGDGHAQAGRWDLALLDFRRVLELAPAFPGVASRIAEAEGALAPRGGTLLVDVPAAPVYAPPPAEPLQEHIEEVVRRISQGRVVVFLGDDINLSGRSLGAAWGPGHPLPPTADELARYLAGLYPAAAGPAPDLARVSQLVATLNGVDALYDDLSDAVAGGSEPTPVHRVLARLPGLLKEKGYAPSRPLLVLTAAYDDATERAFAAVNEPVDLIWYRAEGQKEERARFWHRPHDGDAAPINDPDGWLYAAARPLLVKLHGALGGEPAGFAVTEDHLIDYLARRAFPAHLRRRLGESHVLFLGCALGTWHQRVAPRRIWDEGRLGSSRVAWAVVPGDDPTELRSWETWGVTSIRSPLMAYVAALEAGLTRLERRGEPA